MERIIGIHELISCLQQLLDSIEQDVQALEGQLKTEKEKRRKLVDDLHKILESMSVNRSAEGSWQ